MPTRGFSPRKNTRNTKKRSYFSADFAFLANLVFKHRSLDRKTGFEQKVAKTAKIRRAKTPLAFFVLLSEKFSSAARIFAAKEHKEHKEKKLLLCGLCVLLWRASLVAAMPRCALVALRAMMGR